MSLYAIGDLHLSLGCDKPMDVFGGRWENYVEKILEGFEAVRAEDTTVLCGDHTWGMNLEEAREDFLFINALPGKKIILKGNHDYWWSTASKAYEFFAQCGIDSISILNNNCYFYDGLAICGTRGWFYEEEKGSEHDKKVLSREVLRLEASLRAAGDAEKMVFLHYPPVYGDAVSGKMVDIMLKFGVKRCYYGHLHGASCRQAIEGEYLGIDFSLISADHLNFCPKSL